MSLKYTALIASARRAWLKLNEFLCPPTVSIRNHIEGLEPRMFLSVAPLAVSSAPLDQALTSDPAVQQNPSIAADPLNPKHLVVSYLDYSLLTSGYAGIAVGVSENAGVTWSTTHIPLPADFDQGAATPVTHFDNEGHVYVSFSAATFLGTKPGLTDPDFFDANQSVSDRTYGLTSNNGIFVARSDDGGSTWNTPSAVVSHLYDGTDPVLFEVTPDLAVDTFAKLPDGKANPNYGNLYEVWTRNYTPGTMPGDPTFTGGTDGMIAVSKDHGLTWHLQVDAKGVTAIDDPVRDLSDAGPGLGYVDQVHVTVGPEGDVYVSDYGGGDFSVLHSTDAGQTFAAPDHNSDKRVAFGAGFNTFADSTLPNDQFRTNSLRDIVADPSQPGVVYAADTNTNAFGDTDVYFARSTDYGVTWSGHFKIGTLSANVLDDVNGGVQATTADSGEIPSGDALVRMSVDANGDIAVIWYDTRVDPANHLLNVFGTVSTDGGKTFSPNFRLTSSSFDPDNGVFTDAAGRQDYYLGDFLGLTIADNTAYATWTDTLNGNQDIYATHFSLTSPPAAYNDRFEPNNSRAVATDLGTVLQSDLPRLVISADDADWFSFSPGATGQMSLTATQTASSSQLLKLQLWDSTGGTLLATGSVTLNKAGEITSEQISAPGTSGTAYLLEVTPLGAGTAYSLQLQCLTRNLGTQVVGQENQSLALGGQDVFLLKAAAAGTLQVQLTPGSDATGSMTLNILDAAGVNTLATGTASGTGADQTATLTVTQGEAILLNVSGDSTTSGSYNLSYTNLDQNTVASPSTVLPSGADPSETVEADLSGNGKQDIVVADAASNTISVLMNNGDGTFQAPRQYAVGPYGSTALLNFGLLPNFRRSIAVADFNHDGIPDIVVTNYASGDVSVLLGNGDGTFQPQRRFNAVADPFDLAVGDLTGNKVQDIVTVSANTTPGLNLLQESVGVLLGRGDGTFLPPKTFTITLPPTGQSPLASIRIADVNGDGKPDLIVSGGSDSDIRVFLGNGDGSFKPGVTLAGEQLGTGLLVANLDGHPDIINASFGDGNADFFSGNGDGTFAANPAFGSYPFVGQSPVALALADLGSVATDGSGDLGPPDGHPDLIVVNSGVNIGLVDDGLPGVEVLPSTYDSDGNFTGFGGAISLYSGIAPEDVSTADLNGDGLTDLVVTDKDGIHVIFGGTPTIVSNDTPQTALDLGSVVHLAEPALTIVPGHTDAYFKLTAPTEAASGTGDEVLDFSALFQHVVGAGLTMQVLDSSGNVLASGDQFTVMAKQGQALTVHIHGIDPTDVGAFTLDIDALPQVVSVAAESSLPGAGGAPGGPVTSLVVTFEGDRLDPTEAQDPANYQVIQLGQGTAAGQTIAVGSGQSIIYDPGANLDVVSGKVYPKAVKQTVTLLFDQPLAAGSYEIKFSPNIQSNDINADEASFLASDGTVVGHPLVSLSAGKLIQGANVVETDLVSSAKTTESADGYQAGTPFLAQLHSDLNAILDAQLSKTNDNPALTSALLAQLLKRFEAGQGGSGLPPTLILFLDPVSLNLSDPSGNHISYNLQTNALSNPAPDAFVSVTGNVEVLVMPIEAGSYNLDLADVPSTGRGGLAIVGAQTQETMALTDEMRAGQTDFNFSDSNAISSQFAVATDLHPDFLPSTNTATDAPSQQDQVFAGASTASTEDSSSSAADTAPVTDDALSYDTADDQGQPNQRKKHAHPADKDAQQKDEPGPTSKPSRMVGPTSRASADPEVPSKADLAPVPTSVHTAAMARATERAAGHVAGAGPQVHVSLKTTAAAKHQTPSKRVVVANAAARVEKHIFGLSIGSLLCSLWLFEQVGGKSQAHVPSKRKRRSA